MRNKGNVIMLDLKIIRTNPQEVKDALRRRNADYDAVIDELLEIDVKRREISTKADNMKAQQNAASKKIPMLKKAGEDVSAIMEEMKSLSEQVKECNAELSVLEEKQRYLLLTIPNTPNSEIPDGKDDSDNVEIRRWGEPKNFDFEAKAHWDIGADLGILDPETAGKVTGARFHFYRGLGARLERAVINYYLDTHTENGYTEILPPFMVNRASMTGTGQLPKFEEDAFKVENTDYFLIPTAEVPVTNIHRDEILNNVWGYNYVGDFKIVDVNIRRIRQKIEDDPSNPKYIEKVWGYGYRWWGGGE